MKTKLILFFTFSFIGFQLSAGQSTIDLANNSNMVIADTLQQQESLKVTEWESSTSLFIELLGKGFYSLNLDYRNTKKQAFSLGLQVAEGGFLPSIMYYHFGGARFRFEMGGGLGTVFTKTDGLGGMSIHGVIGYRYQKKKGLLFRAGFTPFVGIPFTDSGRFLVVPLVGISFGYSF